MILKNRLVIARTEFNRSLESFRSRNRLYEAAGIAFEAGILSLQVDDVMVTMRATGEWQGTAEFSPQVIIALLKVPPTEDPVVLSYEDARISVGPLSVPCQWTTLSQEFIDIVENPGVLDLLAIDRSMPKAEIHRTGLWRRISRAKATVTLAVGKSAKILQELEISESELRDMVEARIQARLKDRSPESR